MKKIKHILWPVLFFSFTATLYLHNVTRDVYSGDIGDLVTASFVRGVAHPPGYPLFVALGAFFSQLPITIPIVSKVALISVFASLIGLIFFYLFSLRLLKNIYLSLLSTSILAFSYLFWLHAELPEVFGLNNMFVMLLFYCSYLFYDTKKRKYLYSVALFTGLSLTHHQTILLILPAVGLLVLGGFKDLIRKSSKSGMTLKQFFKVIGISFALFLLGLLPYLYVPLAASRNPVINWDNVTTVNNFMRLLLRKDYGGFAPSVDNGIPVTIKFITTVDYFKTLVTLFSYQIVFLAILGAVKLFKKDKYVFIALLIGFIVSGPFFIYYSTSFITTSAAWGILERFYIMSTIVFALFIPYGLLLIKDFLIARFSRPLYTYILISYFLIVPVMMIIYNFPKTDLSETRIGNTLAENVLKGLPKNALLYVSGDTTVFNTWYLHYVLGERSDIELINPPGVGGNIFLDNEINVYHRSHPDVPVNQVLNKTLEGLRKKRRIYGTYKMNFVPADSVLLPKGVVYELIYKKDIPEKKTYLEDVETALKKLKISRSETLTPAEVNLVATEIPLIYSNALVRIGDFVDLQYKDPVTAEHYYRRALWIDPDNPSAYAGLAFSQLKGAKDCIQSIQSIDTAIEIYPIWKTYYLQKYIMEKQCKVEDKEIKNLEVLFNSRFKLDLKKEVEKTYGKQ